MLVEVIQLKRERTKHVYSACLLSTFCSLMKSVSPSTPCFLSSYFERCGYPPPPTLCPHPLHHNGLDQQWQPDPQAGQLGETNIPTTRVAS